MTTKSDFVAVDLEQRLLKAGEPKPYTKWFDFEDVSYIRDCGVLESDVPELIKLAEIWLDEDALDERVDARGEEQVRYLPICAWRALGELQAMEAVDPLLILLNEIADEDDWSAEEIPRVFGLIGECAIDRLIPFANCDSNLIEARVGVIDGLTYIASSATRKCSGQAKQQVIDLFTETMRQAGENPRPIDDVDDPCNLDFVRINSTILNGMLVLRVAEAAPLIEKAFAENQFDCGVAGDWKAISNQLGVVGSGLGMPQNPINCMVGFRKRMGFGIFSNQSLMVSGEIDDEAAHMYYENAMDAFGRSAEGQEVCERFGTVGWVYNFLEFGISYLGQTVDTMTVGEAEEIVFDIIPRKVSTDADRAESIVFELRKFWQFIGRVYDLPKAKQMVALFNGKATKRLRQELENPQNFGMAKSFFMQGLSAGFDMTSPEGLNQFMLAYNANRIAGLSSPTGLEASRSTFGIEQWPAREVPPKPKMSATEKKAFNKKRKKKLAQKMKNKNKR